MRTPFLLLQSEEIADDFSISVNFAINRSCRHKCHFSYARADLIVDKANLVSTAELRKQASCHLLCRQLASKKKMQFSTAFNCRQTRSNNFPDFFNCFESSLLWHFAQNPKFSVDSKKCYQWLVRSCGRRTCLICLREKTSIASLFSHCRHLLSCLWNYDDNNQGSNKFNQRSNREATLQDGWITESVTSTWFGLCQSSFWASSFMRSKSLNQASSCPLALCFAMISL
ncbi:hypothetical protein BH10CYA1_BH10CYA1_61320 [soil metagenome]